jgi:hypothetical protein
VAVAIDELETLAAKIAGAALQLGHQLGLGDGGRHVPVGAELDEAHVLGEERRAGVQGLADDHPHLQRQRSRVAIQRVGAQHELGHIHHDAPRRPQARRPAQAFEAEHDLAHPARR